MVSEPLSLPPTPPQEPFHPFEASKPCNDSSIVKIGVPLKSNLKCPSVKTGVVEDSTKLTNDEDFQTANAQFIERRSIKWMDNHGKTLTEVKEFDPRYFTSFYVYLWLILTMSGAIVLHHVIW
mgnify:FL=1